VENPSDNAMEFARRRLHLGENLYYKMLEKILVSEQQRISAINSKAVDFLVGLLCYVVKTVWYGDGVDYTTAETLSVLCSPNARVAESMVCMQ